MLSCLFTVAFILSFIAPCVAGMTAFVVTDRAPEKRRFLCVMFAEIGAIAVNVFLASWSSSLHPTWWDSTFNNIVAIVVGYFVTLVATAIVTIYIVRAIFDAVDDKPAK